MRLFSIFLFLLVTTLNLSAQIDSKKNTGRVIPAIETPDDPSENKKITPQKIKPNTNVTGITSPKIVNKLEIPEKELSMFPQEEFANPGTLYLKKLERIEKSFLPEGHGSNAGLKNDAYWGDYKTTSKSIRVLFRDYSAIDGDLLRVYVNDNIIEPRAYLTQSFSGFKLDLNKGVNKIVFQAINTGSSGPNTAEYRIVDENDRRISSKVWALEAGVKVTVVIIKE